MILELIRFRSDQIGTFGALIMPGRGVLCTVERPWVGGKDWPFGVDEKSCIPAGMYKLTRDHSPKFGKLMWYVTGEGVVIRALSTNPIPWREGVMFHAANRPSELMGCIAPGVFYSPQSNSVGNSKLAMTELTAYLDTIAEPQLLIRSAA